MNGLYGNPLDLLGSTTAPGQLWQQQQLVGSTANSLVNAIWPAVAYNNGSTYVMNVSSVEAVPAIPAGPETALQWLDRRVNEIRLPLAA